MAINKNSELVDLATLDRELERLMIEEYPGIITGEQHYIDTDADGKVYRFSDLKVDELLPFLEEHAFMYEYEVLSSRDGTPIKINKVQEASYLEQSMQAPWELNYSGKHKKLIKIVCVFVYSDGN